MLSSFALWEKPSRNVGIYCRVPRDRKNRRFSYKLLRNIDQNVTINARELI